MPGGKTDAALEVRLPAEPTTFHHQPWVLYDEFDADLKLRGRCTHSLLLSNGAEIRARFAGMEVREV